MRLILFSVEKISFFGVLHVLRGENSFVMNHEPRPILAFFSP